MKAIIYAVSIVFCVCLLSTYSFAQKIVVIKPFEVNAPGEYAYLASALPSIIESRISSHEIIAQQQEVETAHSVIRGVVSVLGNHVSIDIRLEIENGGVYIYPISATKDTILPEVEQIIPAMQANIQGGGKPVQEESEQGDKSKIALLSTTDWQSAIALSIAPRGLRIADLDKNGEKEYILLGEKELLIYERDGTIFNEKARYTFNGKQQAKYVAVAPINTEEIGILVTVMIDARSAYSYIFTYKEGSLSVVSYAEPYLLGAYYDASQGVMVPILQSISSYPTTYFSSPVYRFTVEEKKIRKGERIELPHQGNVFNFTTLMIEDELCIALLFPELETISVYKANPLTLLYKTVERYSSTTHFMNLVSEHKVASKGSAQDSIYYMPTHFIHIPGEDKRPVLLLSNAVNRSSVTTTYRSFSKYIIEGLRFSKDSFQNIWSSPSINASVADFDIAVDDKGTMELFVFVTYTPMIANFQKHRSSLLFQSIGKEGE